MTAVERLVAEVADQADWEALPAENAAMSTEAPAPVV
jgi:hypothetical protein